MKSWLLVVLVLGQAASPAGPAPAVVEAARDLLATLTPDQRERAVQPLASPARENWYYTPQPDRRGLPIGAMTPTQQYLTQALLARSLSSVGHAKTATIMSLESVLREQAERAGNAKLAAIRDPGAYHLTVFGEPSATQPWAWSFEGHHVSWNFTMVDGRVIASSPAFLGANPHGILDGPRQGLRVLGEELDRGLALLRSLSEDQLEKAIIANELARDQVTGNVSRLEPGPAEGLPAAEMTAAQRELLDALLGVYVDNLGGEAAQERRQQIAAAGTDLHFAWIGAPTGEGRQYYRIQAPGFLVEFINVQNDGNHVHSVWRDFEGDFGRDVLGEHLGSHPH